MFPLGTLFHFFHFIMKHFILLSFLIVGQLAFGQISVKGKVIDFETKEPFVGARILFEPGSFRSITDDEGNFESALPAGTYNMKIYTSYTDTLNIPNLKIKEAIHLGEFVLGEAQAAEVEEIVISAVRRVDNVAAINSLKMNAANTMDGISSSQLKKTGDGDAAQAMSRVTGVSVANGKYIYVRGIGDRYNKTLLNGADIPSLDPDKNAVQMDLFPVGIVENIMVSKSMLAELPADFAGGVVDIRSKSIPDRKGGSAYLNLGYNPSMHFNSSYLNHKGSGLEFLGFGGKSRNIPTETLPQFAKVIGNPNGAEGQAYQNALKAFNPNMAAQRASSLMDAGFGFNFGNAYRNDKRTLGYQVQLGYSNQTEYYSEVMYNRYGLNADPRVTSMDRRIAQQGELGVNTVQWNALATIGRTTKRSSQTFLLMHVQSGESKSGIFNYQSSDQGANFAGFQHNLEYSQRSLSTIQFIGKNELGNSGKWAMDYVVAPSYSMMNDPDVRLTRYEDRGSYLSISTESGFPQRIWRELDEVNTTERVNFKRKLNWFGRDGELKFGASHSFKTRNFQVRTFMINVRGIDLTGNPDELFAEENLWPYNGSPMQGTTVEANFLPVNPNQFQSNVQNFGGYGSLYFQPMTRMKATIGLRSEYYVQRYTGQDQLGVNKLSNASVINDLGFFPTANFTFAITEKQNLRLAYGKTTVRSTFKEMSYAEIYDPITGRTFIGGMFADKDPSTNKVYWDGNLRSTQIHNLDLRWEIYPSMSQIISFGVFYKKFIDPIEIVQFATQAGSFQPRNVGDGDLYGLEAEFQMGLNKLWSKLEGLNFITNVTISQSRIRMSSTEFESRQLNAREGEEVSAYRRMAGQSPFVVNAGFTYARTAGKAKGLDFGLFYNVQGSTLVYVGMVDRPDVYSVPFHSLNFTASYKWGAKDQWNVLLKANNLLNDKREEVYKNYGSTDELFSSVRPSVLMTARITYSF